MKLERIETPGIAHYAYLLADGGEAVLVDPSRDPQPYLDAARRMGVRIRFVLETHRQEDFVMGSAEIARRCEAKIVSGRHEIFAHSDIRLDPGECLTLGALRIEARPTPGHTPESHCYVVYQGPGEAAWAVFSGDTLFYGETGRTDLPDAERTPEFAGQLYDAVQAELAPLPDACLLLPAHGPGSVCGSGMAEQPLATIGEERRRNPVFTQSRAEYVASKGSEIPPRPPFFRLMEEVNLAGGLAPRRLPRELPLLPPATLRQALEGQPAGALVIDTREPEAYAGGHAPGSLSIWTGGLPVFAGWVAGADTPVYLITESEGDIELAAGHLERIGLDGVRGALAGGFARWRSSGHPIATAGTITPRALAPRTGELQIVDVREDGEFASGHIEGAVNVYVGTLATEGVPDHLDPNAPTVVTCGVGHRAGLGLSLLQRAGFQQLHNLLGGMSAWKALELPLVRPRD